MCIRVHDEKALSRLLAPCVLALLCVLGVTHPNRAHAQVGPRALPTLLTTPRLLRPKSVALTVLGSAGYGAREKFAGADVRHTALGALALALNGPSGIGGELHLNGRLEVPTSGAEAKPASVGELRGFLRFGKPVAPKLDLGFEVGLWIPGAKAPSLSLDATTVDGVMIFDTRVTEHLAWIVAGGFRLDHSKQALPAERLSRDDWVALGLSSWNAALARIGGELTLGRTRSFVEWTWDVFVGSTAPKAIESPMYAALGTRIDLDRKKALVLNLSARTLLSQRARIDLAGPVLPYPPRTELWTALSYTFGGGEPATKPTPNLPPKEPVAPAPPKPREAVVAVPDATEAPATLTVRVVDKASGPVVGANVQVGSLAPVVTDANGAAHLHDVPLGEQPVTVIADGFDAQSATLQVAPGVNPGLELALEAHHPSGQLRFLVRDHGTGEPLKANIIVTAVAGGMPIEHTAGADGRFELELPPGRYEIKIKLYGWRKQVKTVEIEDESVTMIDAALHPRSRRR